MFFVPCTPGWLLVIKTRNGLIVAKSRVLSAKNTLIRGACKNDSHFFLTLSFLVSDANDIDTKEEGEEKDEDALSFPIHL